ncbi:Hypothetical predicted protein [Podarcis lilfordi]|uniref:Uncharacterized protein n=1 Tax=Podarcis lilfordi TaxID=74358 RepID=A0AA35K0Z6_9SAUR|nr:Hypothetical predicted protein [Podarcis lilfordi]
MPPKTELKGSAEVGRRVWSVGTETREDSAACMCERRIRPGDGRSLQPDAVLEGRRAGREGEGRGSREAANGTLGAVTCPSGRRPPGSNYIKGAALRFCLFRYGFAAASEVLYLKSKRTIY